jgi:hypothetical protein
LKNMFEEEASSESTDPDSAKELDIPQSPRL